MAARFVLVGSGPASVAAAEAIRAEDASAEITMVGMEADGYYSRPGLAYYLAKEIPEKRLCPFRPDETLGVRYVQGTAIRLEPAEHRVTLEDGRVLGYDRLLLATGSRAIPVDVPGAQLDGTVSLDDIRDARDIISRSGRAKAAVVLGGGITALEIVEGLTRRKVETHYLMRKDRYWSNVLSESESKLVERGLRDCGVRIHYRTELAEILGRNGRVVGVGTGDGRLIPCDVVAVAIGVRPQIALAESAGLECGRGVLVDGFLRTSAPDVFAAGDIAEVLEPLTGQRTIEVLWSSAVAKGRVAGRNMVDGPVHPYEKGAPLNVTRLAGFKITIIGTVGSGKDDDMAAIARGDSETWRRQTGATNVEWDDHGTHVRLALGDDRMLGAIVMGDQSLSFPLQELIVAGADISTLRPKLESPTTPLSEVVREFCDRWRGQHA